MTEKRSEKKRKILRVLIGILLVMIAVICCLHFGEKQIQRMMQKIICAKVIKYEDELLEIAKNLDEGKMLYRYEKDEDDSDSSIKTIYYKDLEDENVDRIFRAFRLLMVYKSVYVYGDESVKFYISPTVISALWDDYSYGFYYIENDEPVDVIWGTEVEETEFEHTADIGRYWYRTEKITDNFWYYEAKWLWFYPVKR